MDFQWAHMLISGNGLERVANILFYCQGLASFQSSMHKDLLSLYSTQSEAVNVLYLKIWKLVDTTSIIQILESVWP